MRKLFITATDTDAGKTFVATALVKALVNSDNTVAVYKPISAGCDIINGELVNEDAFLLQQASNCNQALSQINPIVFKEPIAPHIAAAKSDDAITVNRVLQNYSKVTSINANYTITEGAGGWRLPLGGGNFLSEFVKASEQKVILIVNMKLGCLNHAILTYESILADGLECIGWVANTFEGMNYLEENIQELTSLIKAPMIARLGKEATTDLAAKKININFLT